MKLELSRRIDWERKLNEAIVAQQSRPFQYGKHDCCTFISYVIEYITDVDPMPEFRGQYSDLKTAKEALKTIGSGSLLKTLQNKFPSIHPAMAKRGDVVYMRNTGDQTPSCGICIGRKSLFITENGLTLVPTLKTDKAFRIG